jgi:hypothetical protein
MNNIIVERLTHPISIGHEIRMSLKITQQFIEIGIVIATFLAVQSFPI